MSMLQRSCQKQKKKKTSHFTTTIQFDDKLKRIERLYYMEAAINQNTQKNAKTLPRYISVVQFAIFRRSAAGFWNTVLTNRWISENGDDYTWIADNAWFNPWHRGMVWPNQLSIPAYGVWPVIFIRIGMRTVKTSVTHKSMSIEHLCDVYV